MYFSTNKSLCKSLVNKLIKFVQQNILFPGGADFLMVRQRAAGHEGLATVLHWAAVGRLSCVGVGVLRQLLFSQELEVAVLAGETLVVNVVHLDVSLHLLLVNELFATQVTVEESRGMNPLDVILDITGLDELPLAARHRAADGGRAVDLLQVLLQLGCRGSPVAAVVAAQTSLSVDIVDVLPQTGLDPGGVVAHLAPVLRHLPALQALRVLPDHVISQLGHNLPTHITGDLTGSLHGSFLFRHGAVSLGQDGSDVFQVDLFLTRTGVQTSTEI